MEGKTLHIGLNGSMLDEHPTGVGVYSLNVINNLIRSYRDDLKKKITVFTPTKSFLNEETKTVLLPRFLKSSEYGKLAALVRFIWNTCCYPIQARKCDLLISPTTHGSFFLRNQIITIHDLLSLRFNNISFHQRIYFKHLLPFMLRRAKVIVAVSESTKKDIVELLGVSEEKVTVIYNGYDPAVYNQSIIEPGLVLNQYGVENYFLAIGPTYPHKNFEFLIHTYNELDSILKEQYPLLIVGGKDPYLKTLKNLVASLKLEKCIRFTGYVPSSMMPFLYKEAKALIFPSLFEGFGFPLLEAMASGCPVITSDVSSMPEVGGNAVLYFDPRSNKSLLNQITCLVSDEKTREDLVSRGVLQAKKFSWDKTIEQFQMIIKTSCSKK